MEQRFPRRWGLKTKIDYLQRKIVSLSIAYYELSQSPVDDMVFDTLCKQLVSLHKEYGDISNTELGYAFGNDFDGSTGFYLWDNLNSDDKDKLLRFTNIMLRGNRDMKNNTMETRKLKKTNERGKLF